MFQQTRITRKLHGALFNMRIILQKASVRSIIFNKKNFGPKNGVFFDLRITLSINNLAKTPYSKLQNAPLKAMLLHPNSYAFSSQKHNYDKIKGVL